MLKLQSVQRVVNALEALVLNHASPEQLEMLGTAGHSQVAPSGPSAACASERWPDRDMKPWFAALA